MYSIFEELCKTNNITPYKVGKETGIATSTLSDWKNGKSTPKQNKLKIIADYFKVSLEYLMTGKDTATTFSDENAHLIAKIRADKKLADALQKYFEFDNEKKKHVVELINLLSE